jgi:hypothetical protein
MTDIANNARVQTALEAVNFKNLVHHGEISLELNA